MEAKKNFVTFLMRAEVISSGPNPKLKDFPDAAPYAVTVKDYIPEISNGEVVIRETKRDLNSNIEVKKTGLVTFEIKVKAFKTPQGEAKLSTRITAVTN